MHDDGTVDELGDGADSGSCSLATRFSFSLSRRWGREGRNIRNNQTQHDIQRRTASHVRRRGDVENEPDQPDDGFDARGCQVEGWVQASPGEEADFDEGEEDGEAAEAHDCAAAGSV